MKEKLFTRKNFFTIAGLSGLGMVILKNNPAKRLFSKTAETIPAVEINPLAVKREKRGKLNG